MSRNNPAPKWVLPLVMEPPTSTCYLVPVPDDIYHRAAFMGALATLGHWTAWKRDAEHRGAKAAGVWQRIADNLKSQPCDVERQLVGGVLEDCGMRLRISPTNTCIIQCFDECAQTWGDWFDVSQCVPAGATQPGPGGSPDVGSEHCYDTVIPGNSQWISPIPIVDGDVVEISLVGGGWFDGAGWYCPNGQTFVLGGCTGAGTTSGTDPAPSINHGRLIASTDGGASWQDGYNTDPLILAGQTATNLLLQMNDDTLGDNYGSIHLRVCIKHNLPSAWSIDFDFTLGSGGFQTRNSSGVPSSSWVGGTGWARISSDGANYIQFTLLHTDFILTKLWADYVTNAAFQSYQGLGLGLDTIPTNNLINDSPGTLANSPGGRIEFDGSHPGAGNTTIYITAVSDPAGTVSKWTHAHAEGTGTNPFI